MAWIKMQLSDVLTNRDGRYKPNDNAIADLKRIDKINFSGQIFLSNKESNTDMILVKKGDLFISGINVEKGAITVYEGEEDITATIHYSSYIFNKEKIDIEFLKVFLRSPDFIQLLKEQVPGGIKTEIKPKHILPLEVYFPDTIKEQKKIAKHFFGKEGKFLELKEHLSFQLTQLDLLNHAILQEAVQGKLVPQNKNDESASVLIKRIKAEKAKSDKKEKPLPTIKPEEIPFEIPENWVWCRLGEIALSISTGPFGTMLHQPDYVENGIPLVNPMNIINEKIVASNKMMISPNTLNRLKNYTLRIGDVVIGRRGEMGRCAAVTENEDGWLCGTGSFFLRLHNEIYRPFFIKILGSEFAKSFLLTGSVGATMNNLNHRILNNLPIPLPPLSEQTRIVAEIEKQLAKTKQLKEHIIANQKATEQLLKALLHGAFEVEENEYREII
jgi:type I restriction enzyme, S subunit